ncbi:hypothetical protein MRB53_008769 [Persea americana]|uniref:Uncharacterized protein n=1 Tax=Persea americana TaxID=3435 RepID=A0ACC2LN36_PERAE|nr:hypothetical protein MRB53_008769 [Persea americana]
MSCIERVKKVGGSSAAKKSRKRICEIINPTPSLVYPTMDIHEDVDMHFSSARDFHTTDRYTRACFDVDGMVHEADDANDVVSATVDASDVVRATIDMSEVHGCPSWMMASNEQGAETIYAVNHSFAMEDVNFVDTMAPQDVIAEIGTD